MVDLALSSSNWIRQSDFEMKQRGWTPTDQVLQFHQVRTIRIRFLFNFTNIIDSCGIKENSIEPTVTIKFDIEWSFKSYSKLATNEHNPLQRAKSST